MSEALKKALLISASSAAFFVPEAFAQVVDASTNVAGTSQIVTIYEWLQNVMKYGIYLIGSAAFLNFAYQLTAVQNMKAAAVSGTTAASAGGLGSQLVTAALI